MSEQNFTERSVKTPSSEIATIFGYLEDDDWSRFYVSIDVIDVETYTEDHQGRNRTLEAEFFPRTLEQLVEHRDHVNEAIEAWQQYDTSHAR